MKVLHLSDSHGRRSQQFGEARVVVHTGDMLPNKTRGDRAIEPGHQERWMRSELPYFARWLHDRTFLFMPGNHDFFDPCPMLRAIGIDARNVWTDGPQTIEGVTFAGVPFVPWMGGDWNYEASEAEIAHYLSFVPSADVLLTHCPPHGSLDMVYAFGVPSGAGRNIGSHAIRAHIERTQPKWNLCGHCHEHGGNAAAIGRTVIVNSATHARILEIEP